METKDKIKSMIKEAGLTQDGFAAKYGIPKNTVHNWCQGVNEPPAYLVDLIWKDATVGETFRAAWVFEEYRDKGGYGTFKIFGTRHEAETFARDFWDSLNDREKAAYRDDPASRFDVTLRRMAWDDIGMEWVPESDSEMSAWSAL